MTAQFLQNNQDGWYAYLDPEAIDDFPIIWSDWLEARNFDVIENSTWIIPAGVDEVRRDFTGGDATIWLQNPSPGRRTLVNRITTVGGRKADQSFVLITRDQ